MPWVLIATLLPFLLFAMVFRRVLRVARLLQDPEQVRRLFSERVRVAIRDAGLDPETVEMEDLKDHEALARMISADLRPQLYSLVLGFRLPGAAQVLPDGPRGGAAAAPLSSSAWRVGPSSIGDGAMPARPPSIDAASGSGIRPATALVIALALAAAAALAVRLG